MSEVRETTRGEPGTDPFQARLTALYAELDAAVAAHAPVCAISGRCCRFEEYGHTLFVSAPELAHLLDGAPPPIRPLDDGATCPWQDLQGRCTARQARPLGCRVYFCDPSFEPYISELSEMFIGRLKRLVDESGLPWSYAPLHWHLARARDSGRFPDPAPVDGRDLRTPGAPSVKPLEASNDPPTTILT